MSANEMVRPTGSSPSTSPAPVRVMAAIVRPVWILAECAMDWHGRWKQRQALMALDDHLLKDIGVSRLDADHEARKPFWRG